MTVRWRIPGREAMLRHLQAIVSQAGVDLIGDNPGIVFLRGRGDVLQVGQGDHAAGGVGGCVEDDQPGASGLSKRRKRPGRTKTCFSSSRGTGTGTPPATEIMAEYVGKPGSG